MDVKIEKTTISCGFLASVIGVEPTAFRLGGEPSILLRYTDKFINNYVNSTVNVNTL